jgi:cytoskeletal protein RodZ
MGADGAERLDRRGMAVNAVASRRLECRRASKAALVVALASVALMVVQVGGATALTERAPNVATRQAPTTTPRTTGTPQASTNPASAVPPPASTAQPASTTPTPTPPASAVPPTSTTPATSASPTTTNPTALAPGQAGGLTRGAVTRRRAHGRKISTAAVIGAALAALLVALCAVWATVRWLAIEPRWTRSMAYSLEEASFRASATWAEFSDWVRLGR